MSLSCGIVGLPNAGKSTIFNALTAAGAQMAGYPFCTIKPQAGIVQVPDERLLVLSSLFPPPGFLPASMEFVDIAGLVQGASRGEGLGNKFLGHIREVDAIAHVVRCFENQEVAHPNGKIDPQADIETITTELILADLETLDTRIQKSKKQAKSKDNNTLELLQLYQQVVDNLQRGLGLQRQRLSAEELDMLKDLHLLTAKPVIYVANVEGSQAEQDRVKIVAEMAEVEGAGWICVSGRVGAELTQLEPEEQEEFKRELGLNSNGLEEFIKASYKLLQLITFFTGPGKNPGRAWPIRQGTTAYNAAGVVHTDMMRGFIRAEVIHYEDLISCGTEHAAKEKGLLQLEGKDYVIQDGDILHFRFHV
jgi:GTP-binding protein YchF